MSEENTSKQDARTSRAITVIKLFLSQTIHGVSHKYVQSYAAQLSFAMRESLDPLN
jgi:hypothetical protein